MPRKVPWRMRHSSLVYCSLDDDDDNVAAAAVDNDDVNHGKWRLGGGPTIIWKWVIRQCRCVVVPAANTSTPSTTVNVTSSHRALLH